MDHPAPPPGFAPEDANWQTTAGRPTGTAATEGHSAGAGSLSSDGSDPWIRRDPWTRLPAQENVNTDYLQFLQSRQGLEAGPATPPTGAQMTPPVRNDFVRLGAQQELHPLHWGHAAREEAERTTAGPPPEWDGAKMEFRDYKIKAKLWLRTTRTPPTARGPMLLKGLTGPPWEHMKFLAADDGWLDNPDNGRILINLMDTKEYYGEEERESMLAACSRITFHLRRAKGEKAQAFMLRWDDAERRVKEKGVNLPGEYQGFLLVTALQLTSDQIKLLLNYTRGSLQVSDVKAWLRIHETDLDITTLGNDKKKSTNEVHTIYEETVQEEGEVLDMEGDLIQDEDTEMLLTTLAEMSDGENDGQTTTEISEGEAKEVLLTMLKERPRTRSFQGAMKAKKNRDLARGFGAGRDGALRPGTYKVSIEELKRRTKCHRCQEVGHWSRECPNKGRGKGDGKPKDIHYITAETSDEIEFLYLDADAASHSDPTVKDTQAEFVYMSVPPIITHEILTMETSVEAGCATIDTGCQRMAIGLDALERYQSMLPPELFIRFRRERHQFRSVHQTSCTERVAVMPSSLGPRGSYLKPAIFEDETCRSAPFLISLPFLLHCGIQLHLDPTFGLLLRSEKLGFSARCHLGPTGALRVFLQDFSEDQIRRLAGKQDSKHVEYELLRTEHSAGSTENARSSHSVRPVSEHAEPPQEEPHRGRGEHLDDSSVVPDGATSLRYDHPSASASSSLPDPHSRTTGHEVSTDHPVRRPPRGGGVGRDRQPLGGEAAGTKPPGGTRSISISDDGGVPVHRHRHTDRVEQGNRSNPHGTGSQHVADPPGTGSSISPTMPLPAQDQAVHLHDTEELPAAFLALPSRTRSTMPLLPMVGPSQELEKPASRLPGRSDLRGAATTVSVAMPTQEDHQTGEQRIPGEGDLQGVWQGAHRRDHRSGEGALSVQGPEGSIHLIKELHTLAGSRDSVSSGGVRLPGISSMEESTKGNSFRHAMSVVETTSSGRSHRDDRAGGLPGMAEVQASPSGEQGASPTPLSERRLTNGLRHNMVGRLKQTERLWHELDSLLSMDHSEPMGTPLAEVYSRIRKAAHHGSQQLKTYKELFSMDAKQLSTVMEICNPGCFNKQADNFGLRCGQVFDIVLGWDLLNTQSQQHVVQYIKSERPGLVLLAPPCTMFSTLQHLSIRTRHANSKLFDDHLRELRRARNLLKFCVEVCQLCRELKLTYVFEHPWGATSWSEPCLKRLVQQPDSYLARVDQCQFGLVSSQGNPMRKRSGFLTNLLDLATSLNRTCHGDHQHEHIVGRAPGDTDNRSRMAQRYPKLLIQCILGTYAANIGLNASELHHVHASHIITIDEQLTKKFQLNSLAVGDAVRPRVGEAVPLGVGVAECHAIESPETEGDHDDEDHERKGDFPGVKFFNSMK